MTDTNRIPPVITAMSDASDPYVAASELAQALCHPELEGVIFFCSAEYDLEHLAAALNQSFANTCLVGCTTAGEITPRGYDRGTIVGLGFHRDSFTMEASLIADLDQFSLPEAQAQLDQLIRALRQRTTDSLAGRCFAMTLLDGLSSQEELVLVALDSALGSIPHFGGSAGDDIQLAGTHVFYQGAFHNEAAVLTLMHTVLDFEVFSTHHMQSLATKLVVTQADSDKRQVIELNAEPAAQVYARMLGIEPEELNPKVFALHPLAVKLGQEYYVRSIQKVNEDMSLTFYCAVGNGMVLTAMQPQPILPDLERRFAHIEARIGEPMITLGCDCFLRRLETEHLGSLDEASAFFREHRVIGFNTYGEHFDGVHINQTFTGVVIGKETVR
ncbi:nitric oxide-sensing protein NosP [Nitrincola schmidtii]|uniref:nitric oxide-sensing protein NosP n=1 Tax=Nitrincola schmidtii TaxID=1730894 RepID=UPI00124E0534|nr:nitric oxide-sensing protein NosP [Nitrincola schmidtii]